MDRKEMLLCGIRVMGHYGELASKNEQILKDVEVIKKELGVKRLRDAPEFKECMAMYKKELDARLIAARALLEEKP